MKILPKPLSPIYNVSRLESEVRQKVLINKYSPKNGNICDLCCGSGQYRAYFEDYNYIGIDMYDNNFKKKEKKGVKFLIESAECISLKNESIDFIFCSAGLEHVVNDQKVVSEIARVMKPNSYGYIAVPSKVSRLYEFPRIIYCYFTKQKIFGHGYHYYSKKSIVLLIKNNNLDIVKVYPETGFLALNWITFTKWKKSLRSIIPAIIIGFIRKVIFFLKKHGTNFRKNSQSNVINTTKVDPRSDYGYKPDYSDWNKEDIKQSNNYYKEYNGIVKLLAISVLYFDHFFPIPIVAAWIVIFKKPKQ